MGGEVLMAKKEVFSRTLAFIWRTGSYMVFFLFVTLINCFLTLRTSQRWWKDHAYPLEKLNAKQITTSPTHISVPFPEQPFISMNWASWWIWTASTHIEEQHVMALNCRLVLRHWQRQHIVWELDCSLLPKVSDILHVVNSLLTSLLEIWSKQRYSCFTHTVVGLSS